MTHQAAVRLSNGTVVEILPGGTRITLPGGQIVEGSPQGSAEQAQTARDLGYGDDTLAMCRDHDPLHALLCAWLTLPASFALAAAAGILPHKLRHLADAEEHAVIALQKFMRLAGAPLPKDIA